MLYVLYGHLFHRRLWGTSGQKRGTGAATTQTHGALLPAAQGRPQLRCNSHAAVVERALQLQGTHNAAVLGQAR